MNSSVYPLHQRKIATRYLTCWLPVGLVFTLLLLALQSANATLLYEEGFNYPSGALSGNDSWLGGASGLTVGNANLTYPGLADAANPGNDLVDTQGTAGSMTVNFTGSAITSGSVYYSFLAEATALPTANNFLSSLLPTGGSPNGGTDPLAVYVGQQTAGSTFKIGVRHQGINSGATYATNPSFTAGTVNFFVVKYTFGSGGTVSLYVNPTAGAIEPVANVIVGAGGTEAANLQTLGFKAQGNSTTGNWIFDTLRVGDTWADVTPSSVPEPSAVALAMMAGFALFIMRRRQTILQPCPASKRRPQPPIR
jgi:hypothetical protein